MGCRCNERRAAIRTAGQAAKSGNIQAVKDQARFVAVSMVEDASRSLASRVSAAKLRLGRR